MNTIYGKKPRVQLTTKVNDKHRNSKYMESIMEKWTTRTHKHTNTHMICSTIAVLLFPFNLPFFIMCFRNLGIAWFYYESVICEIIYFVIVFICFFSKFICIYKNLNNLVHFCFRFIFHLLFHSFSLSTVQFDELFWFVLHPLYPPKKMLYFLIFNSNLFDVIIFTKTVSQ